MELISYFLFQIMGSKGDMEAQIEEQTCGKINQMNRNVAATKEKAMQRLLAMVTDIKPEFHTNARIN